MGPTTFVFDRSARYLLVVTLFHLAPPSVAREGVMPAGERAHDRLHTRVPSVQRRQGGVRVLRKPRQAASGIPRLVRVGGSTRGANARKYSALTDMRMTILGTTSRCPSYFDTKKISRCR